MPKVSVIMPSYNKAAYIKKSIESIINQSFSDWELIIIDDCSTDNSVEIIKEFQDERVVFSRNQNNLGIAANRNLGIEMSRGEYIALLDADDLSPSYRLEHEVQFLETHPEIDVVYGGCQEIDENDKEGSLYMSSFQNPLFNKAKLMVRDVIPNGSCMYRRNFIDKYAIRYRENCYGMDDYLFWIECSRYGKIAGLPETLLLWRNFRQNATSLYTKNEEYRRLREEKYAEFHERALSWHGFHLEKEELVLYNRILAEEQYKITDEQELRSFQCILNKLCHQAEGMEGEKELKTMFRKLFGLATEHSYLWD